MTRGSAPKGAPQTARPGTIDRNGIALHEASLRVEGAASMLARARREGRNVALATDHTLVWLDQALSWLEAT